MLQMPVITSGLQRSNGPWVLVISLLLSFVGACGTTFTNDNLSGKWVVQYRYSREELVLHKDGTFEQVLAQAPVNVDRRVGKWELRDGKEPQVVLHGALAIDESTGRIDPDLSRVKDGLSFFPVRKHFGKVTLVVNDDLDLSFRRTE